MVDRLNPRGSPAGAARAHKVYRKRDRRRVRRVMISGELRLRAPRGRGAERYRQIRGTRHIRSLFASVSNSFVSRIFPGSAAAAAAASG